MSGPPDFARLGDLLRGAQGAPAVDETCAGAAQGSSTDPGCAGPGAASAPAPRRDPARLLAAVWPDVVGEEVAANARPVQLRQGRLVVSASSSAWAQTLQLMSEAIIVRLNERLGQGTVERIVARHAGWEERPRRRPVESSASGGASGPVAPCSAVSLVPLSKEQEEALAAVARLDLAPELRDSMIRAMRTAFVRAEQDSVR